jgi:hypothetical protein
VQPQQLIIALHYFWVHGTELQKSEIGLSRELLFTIFQQCPTLLTMLLSNGNSEARDVFGLEDAIENLSKLREVLVRLIKTPLGLSTKLYFFVDGLDEYESDESGHVELCALLTDLARSPSVKLCISSRPLNVFEDAFGHDETKKVYMHQVNRGDITRFAHSRLSEHPRWNSVIAQAPEVNSLVARIVERTTGVFLWVFLVTRLLRNGLTNDDSWSDLLKRLDSFPLDLEKFFRHILDSVEPFYHEKMAGALRLALATPEPFDVLVYHFHDRQYDDPSYALNMEHSSFSYSEVGAFRSRTARRLKLTVVGF